MGHINIKLFDLIVQSEISKNKVCYNCEVQRTQLNNYCNNKVTSVDLSLMARLCKYFNCQISDILEYVPDEAPENTKAESESKET